MFCQFLLCSKVNQLYVYTCACAKSLQLCPTLRFYGLYVAYQAPLFMRFSRQEYWSVWPCSPPDNLPDPGIKPMSFMSPALAGGFFTTSTTWEAICIHISPPFGISFPFRSPQSILMGTLLKSSLSYIIDSR